MVIGVGTLQKHQFGLVAKKKFHIHKIVVVYEHFFLIFCYDLYKKKMFLWIAKKREHLVDCNNVFIWLQHMLIGVATNINHKCNINSNCLQHVLRIISGATRIPCCHSQNTASVHKLSDNQKN